MELIENILDISKIEAGKLQLNPVDFSLRVLLDQSCSALLVLARKKGLYLMQPAEKPETLQEAVVKLAKQTPVLILANPALGQALGEALKTWNIPSTQTDSSHRALDWSRAVDGRSRTKAPGFAGSCYLVAKAGNRQSIGLLVAITSGNVRTNVARCVEKSVTTDLAIVT